MEINQMNLHEVLEEPKLVEGIIGEIREKFSLQAGHWPEVHKEPIFWGRLGRERIDGRWALIDRSQENPTYFNVCSDDYLIVPYEVIVKMASDVAEAQKDKYGPASYDLRTYKNGGRFKMRIDFKETGATIQGRKNIPEYNVYSSLDLGKQYNSNWGWQDLVCTNGMIAFKPQNSFKSRHIHSLGEQNISEDMTRFLADFGDTTGILEKWAHTQLTDKMYTQIWEDLTDPKNKVFSVAQKEKIEALPIIGKGGTILEIPKKDRTLFDLQLATSQFVTHELKSEVRRDDIGENLGKMFSRIVH